MKVLRRNHELVHEILCVLHFHDLGLRGFGFRVSARGLWDRQFRIRVWGPRESRVQGATLCFFREKLKFEMQRR